MLAAFSASKFIHSTWSIGYFLPPKMNDKVPEIAMSQFETDKGILEPQLRQYGLEFATDGFHIRWAKGNQRHPRNWSIVRKAYDTSLIIFLELFTYVDCLLLCTRWGSLLIDDCIQDRHQRFRRTFLFPPCPLRNMLSMTVHCCQRCVT